MAQVWRPPRSRTSSRGSPTPAAPSANCLPSVPIAALLPTALPPSLFGSCPATHLPSSWCMRTSLRGAPSPSATPRRARSTAPPLRRGRHAVERRSRGCCRLPPACPCPNHPPPTKRLPCAGTALQCPASSCASPPHRAGARRWPPPSWLLVPATQTWPPTTTERRPPSPWASRRAARSTARATLAPHTSTLPDPRSQHSLPPRRPV
mmetsp:Transcript_101276/g.290561  ORF Transcript_101276/g.290561 Transcript_101276/m.290561 type:complete len:207 (+) Transcript_101276:1026-1646(+)